MTPLSIILRVIAAVPTVVETVTKVVAHGRKRAPEDEDPRPSVLDRHCFSRESPTEPPSYCYYCRQLKAQATKICPGVPKP